MREQKEITSGRSATCLSIYNEIGKSIFYTEVGEAHCKTRPFVIGSYVALRHLIFEKTVTHNYIQPQTSESSSEVEGLVGTCGRVLAKLQITSHAVSRLVLLMLKTTW